MPLARLYCFRVLTCLSLGVLQSVSIPRSLGLLASPNLSFPRCSPFRECPSLTLFVSMSRLVLPSVFARTYGLLFCLLTFCILTFFLLCLQALFDKMSPFISNVLLLSYIFIFNFLTHSQPPLSISSHSGDAHHALIGTFLPFIFAISDIQT